MIGDLGSQGICSLDAVSDVAGDIYPPKGAGIATVLAHRWDSRVRAGFRHTERVSNPQLHQRG
jgi:hypothetical protein